MSGERVLVTGAAGFVPTRLRRRSSTRPSSSPLSARSCRRALKAVRKAGEVVCAEIHMSDIPSFPYELLWGERVVRSVANLTRRDGEEFLALAPRVPVRAEVETFALEEANDALERLRNGLLRGTAVLLP
jgi:D-arabinose 1-dehydrogenase-like Zn-dependent alcohol dehydrogenase